MPWSTSWSGLGPIRATSLAVIGSGTEIDIKNYPGGNGVPPGATILFSDLTGNNAGPSVIFSQRNAATNAMTISLEAAQTVGPALCEVDIVPGDFLVTALGTTGSQAVSTLECQANTGSIIFNQSLQMVNDTSSGQSFLSIVNETWHVPTLQNGWTQTAGYLTFAYRKTAFNTVEFKGTIHAGNVTDSTAIFNLPSGYIAPSQVLFHPATAPTGSGGGSSRIYINLAGQVQIYGMTGVTDIGCDGLSFSLTN